MLFPIPTPAEITAIKQLVSLLPDFFFKPRILKSKGTLEAI